MKLSYTQRVLSRKASPALENENTEEVVDQAVIDAQPSEDIPVSDDATVDETVVSEDPAEEVAEETTVEEPVATDVPVDGIEPIEPPQVVPVTDSGEATVDQVEAIAAGDPEAAAEVVAEVDNAEGADTTAEEVIEEAEEVEAEAPAETDEVDATPEATEELTETEEAPVDVADVTPEGEAPSSDEVVSDIEETEEVEDGSEVSNEGLVGGLLGFLVGGTSILPGVGTAVHGAVKAKRMELKKDIEAIAKRIEKIRKGDLEDAKKNGIKIPKRDLDIDWVEVVKSALLGTFFGPIYGAHQGSELENLNKELRAKLKELQKEMDDAGVSTESMSTTSEEDCACESDGTNPPNEGGTGAGEQHLPSEQVAVDEGKGEEVKPVQEKPVDEGTGESDIEVDQEKPAAEGKGEETLPCESEVVDEGKGENTHDGEIVSAESAEVVEEQVVDAPSENTPEEVAAVVEGEVPVVEEVVTETPEAEAPAAEAPAEGVVEAVAEEPVDLSPESDDGDLVIEDFTTGTEDEESILTEALDTYPQVVDVLEKSLDGKGVSVEAMMILNIFMKRDGNPLQSDVSLENYNFTSRTQTRLAVESIQEDMKVWFERIIAFIKDKMAKGKEFIRSAFSRTDILIRKAEALKGLDQGKTPNGSVSGEFLSQLTTGGKVDGNFAKAFNEFKNKSTGMIDTVGFVIDASNEIHKAVRQNVLDKVMNGEDYSGNGGTREVLSSLYEKYSNVLKRGPFDVDGEGFKYSANLLGGNVFTVIVTGHEWAKEPAFRVATESSEVKEAPALSAADINAVAESAIEILKKIKNSSLADDISKTESALLPDLDRLLKLSNNVEGTGENVKQEITALRAYFQNTVSFLNAFSSSTVSLSIRTVNAALNYAVASAKTAA